ncbi:hypothetical protein KSP39_PZI019212 [Platanthera zijinensis]|uniref:Reverse transcriptase n=1 Tax=Platanthera zijinensis TaxID=2320716 RepID=A0AAP0B145_9ASPA
MAPSYSLSVTHRLCNSHGGSGLRTSGYHIPWLANLCIMVAQCRDVSLEGWPAFSSSQLIDDATVDGLFCDVLEDEIWKAVCSLKDNRFPGLGGITAFFFHLFWLIIKLDACNVLHDFFLSGSLSAHWKETKVVLIPKISNAALPDKFRPISLCQTIYKVAVKVLAGRLQWLLPSLTSRSKLSLFPSRPSLIVSWPKRCFINLRRPPLGWDLCFSSWIWSTGMTKCHGICFVRFSYALDFRPVSNLVLQCDATQIFLINNKRTSRIEAQCGF